MSTPPEIEFIARALILHHSHVLMCRSVSGNYLYLPGGHIEFAESASQALIRELREEADLQIAVGPLLLTTESTFNDGQINHHELTLIFETQLFHMEQLAVEDPDSAATAYPAAGGGGSDGLPEVRSAEEHIEFEWVDLAALTDLDIRPPEIKAWLTLGGSEENHLVHMDPSIR